MPTDDPDDEEPTPTRRPTAAERRLHDRSWPRGVPVVAQEESLDRPPDEITSPWDLPLEPTPRDARAVQRAGRDPGAPVLPIELSAIIKAIVKRLRAEIEASGQAQRAELADLLNRAPRDVAERIEERLDKQDSAIAVHGTKLDGHDREIEPLRRFWKLAAGGAVTAILVVIAFVYARGQSEQLVNDRLQHLEESVGRIERTVERLDHPPLIPNQQGPRP